MPVYATGLTRLFCLLHAQLETTRGHHRQGNSHSFAHILFDVCLPFVNPPCAWFVIPADEFQIFTRLLQNSSSSVWRDCSFIPFFNILAPYLWHEKVLFQCFIHWNRFTVRTLLCIQPVFLPKIFCFETLLHVFLPSKLFIHRGIRRHSQKWRTRTAIIYLKTNWT